MIRPLPTGVVSSALDFVLVCSKARRSVFKRTLALSFHDGLSLESSGRHAKQNSTLRSYSSTCAYFQTTSPFANSGGKKKPEKKSNFTPRKAAVKLTEQARTFFKALLENNPEKAGILLNYQQSSSGEPRMAFSFDFVTAENLNSMDEGVSLELSEDGSPKSPSESMDDGLPKLFIHHNAFMKVLGATVDVNMDDLTLILYDREGNVMDPNA